MPLTASELVLFDGWAEPVVVAGAEGFIVYANPAVEKLLGWPHGGLVGEPLVSIMPARMRERHLAGMARFIETRRPRILGRRVRVPALRRDGREVDIELSISTLQVDGRREMFLATLHDRTGVVELEAQEEMLALLDALLARAPLGFAFVDRSLRYVRANEHLANVTGRPELGYIGRAVQEVHGPISGPELTAVYEQVLATGEPLIGVERSVYTPAHPGPPQQLITSHYPVIARDGSIVGVALIAQDVTAQKKAEAEREVLAERERRAQADAEAERRMLRSLFMQAPAAIAMLRGPECVYELSNPANNAAIDRDPTGLPARVAFPEPEAQEHVERLEHVYRTGQGEVHPELRFQLRTPTGTRELFANVSYVPWRDPDGSIRGVLVFGFDITEQVRARERAMAAERRSREAVRARDDFMSVAGHELRTPLTAVQLQVQNLERQLERGVTDPGELGERVRKLRNNAERLGVLVDDLFDVARIAAGRLLLQREPLDLAQLLRDVCEGARDELERTATPIEIHVPEPLIGAWDRPRVEQVLTNVLGNAIKYGAGKPISVAARRVDGRACIEIRDRGIGIEPEAQARVFAKFESAVSDARYGGLGLGLWISRAIVQAHGGSIALDSTPGEGTRVVIELPLTLS